MKKWICCLLCGTLVLSSFLAAGTSLSYNQKGQPPKNASEPEFIPTMFKLTVTVAPDGTYSLEMDDIHWDHLNNWTMSVHHEVQVQITINNPSKKTGSTSYRWRIAEYVTEGIPGWIVFWWKHGNVVPTDYNQPNFLGTTKMKINWSAADPEVRTYNDTFGIDIVFEKPIQIVMWLSHKGNHDWGKVQYYPFGTMNI